MTDTIAGILKTKFSEVSIPALDDDMRLERVRKLVNSLIPDMITLLSHGHAFYAFYGIQSSKFNLRAKFVMMHVETWPLH